MYAYIDETGNTGANLFDVHQPVFMSGALITKKNFDVVYAQPVADLARSLGAEALHANKLGLKKLDIVAPALLEMLRDADTRIFVSRVVKIDLAAAKLVDTLFDSGENRSVPWHVYNFRPLRLLLVMKVASLLDMDTLRAFWGALMERKPDRAYASLLSVISTLEDRTKHLPDARSRELLAEALRWAREHPEAIHFHATSKALRRGHLPNLVVFPELLGGIERRSQLWRRPVREIKHDRQSQFQGALTDWHNFFSNAAPDPIFWPGGEKHEFRRVFGSKFIISSFQESPGIQVIDNVLWLIKKLEACEPLPPNTWRLTRYLLIRALVWELSMKSIHEYLSDFLEKLKDMPITEEQMDRARELLALAEKRRQKAMAEYAKNRLFSK